MRQTDITFQASTAIELSFASIIPGKESQLFGDYFPKVLPLVGDMGGASLGSSSILQSAATLGAPEVIAFFQWPDQKTFARLHKDPRFQDIKGLRDQALSLFSNGHFFTVEHDTVVTFTEGQAYGLLAEYGPPSPALTVDPLLRLQPTGEAIDLDFNPISVVIVAWSPALDHLMSQAEKSERPPLDIFKFSFNFPETP